MAIARNISINNETYELEPSKGQRVYVGTCSTAAATNPKVCTVEDFPVDENGKPYTGTEIVVKFTATNTSTSTTPELNVNGTGAIRIWYNNAVLASAKSAFAGYANRYMRYVYDGTYWVFMGHSVDNNSTYTNVALGQGYAVQNNSAASATITAALGSYALTVNGIVSVKFTYDVPANATLNINGKGAKAIYNKDAAITAGVIKSGDTATFIYNTYYHLIAIDSWQDKQDTIDDLAAIRSGASLGATALQSYTETDPTVPAWAKASSKPSYTASEVGAVPTTRKVNNKALSSDITLTASDVGAMEKVILHFEYDEQNDEVYFSDYGGHELTHAEVRSICNSGAYIFLFDTNAGLMLIPRELSSDSWEFTYGGGLYNLSVYLYWDSLNSCITCSNYEEEFGVPISRTINSKALTNDIILTSSDVGADVFVVNIENDGSDEYTCDKTNAEIYAAWQSGRNIVLITSNGYLYKLNVPPSQTDCEFSGDDYDDISSYRHYTIFTNNGQQKVVETYIYFQEQLASGTNIKTINNQSLLGSGNLTASDIGALPSSTHIPADQVQSNWNETNTSSKAYIQNKPTIPAAQVNSDWDASSGVAQILNKPTFKTINGESIVGTGDIEAGSGDVATAFTITITSTTIEVQPMTGAMMTVGTDVSFQVV